MKHIATRPWFWLALVAFLAVVVAVHIGYNPFQNPQPQSPQENPANSSQN